MSNFAVFHIEKGTQSTSGLTNHIDRKEESRTHSFPQSDATRQHLNQDINVGYQGSIFERRAQRMKEGYTCGKTLRKDAVPHLSMVLSGTHEQMKLVESKGLINQWVQDNQAWLQKEFGEKNLVKLTLHMDEKTPHLHAIVIPITEKGTLSAKEIMGNSIKMQQRQTSYAEAMAKYGLERGFLGSKVKHEDQKQYKARIENTDDRVFNKFDLLLHPDKMKDVFNENKALKSEVKALKHEIKRNRSKMEEVNKFFEFLQLFRDPEKLMVYARTKFHEFYKTNEKKTELYQAEKQQKSEEKLHQNKPKDDRGFTM